MWFKNAIISNYTGVIHFSYPYFVRKCSILLDTSDVHSEYPFSYPISHRMRPICFFVFEHSIKFDTHDVTYRISIFVPRFASHNIPCKIEIINNYNTLKRKSQNPNCFLIFFILCTYLHLYSYNIYTNILILNLFSIYNSVYMDSIRHYKIYFIKNSGKVRETTYFLEIAYVN